MSLKKTISKKCTCILSFYNEGERVFSVARMVSSLPEIQEIIAVNDGSTDRESYNDLERIPKVKLITLTHNQGKAGAVRIGVEYAQSEYVLLIDGDLLNLKRKEFETGIKKIIADPTIDMIIFRGRLEPWWAKVPRGDVLLSGQRVLRLSDLKYILKADITDYLLETAINTYMEVHKKRAYWIYYTGVNPLKAKKVGYLQGLKRDLGIWMSIVQYKGLVWYARSIVSFCRNPILAS